MDSFNLEPGCYEADEYIVSRVCDTDDSHYYHNYDIIEIDEDYKKCTHKNIQT